MTETIQKEKTEKEQEKIKSNKSSYQDNLSEKGKRDGEINDRLTELKAEAKTKVFNTEMIKRQFESEFIPNLRSQVKKILKPYDLSEQEATRRASEVIEEQKKEIVHWKRFILGNR